MSVTIPKALKNDLIFYEHFCFLAAELCKTSKTLSNPAVDLLSTESVLFLQDGRGDRGALLAGDLRAERGLRPRVRRQPRRHTGPLQVSRA